MTATKSRLTQETIAIVTVGLTLLGAMFYNVDQLNNRIDALQAELRADRDTFTREILRLTEGQARIAALIDEARTP